MAVQTSYSENIAAAKAGQIANMESVNLISRNVETAAGIGFGLPVKQGVADSGVVAYTGTDDVLGITVRERSVNPETPNSFAQYESARVMTKGVIWVTAGDDVVAGDDVFVSATGTFTAEGTDTQIEGARFDSSAADGELVKVRLG